MRLIVLVLLVLFFVQFTIAHPIYMLGQMTVLEGPVVRDGAVEGVAALSVQEGEGIYDGTIIVDLVYLPEEIDAAHGFVQEWVVGRDIITNITVPRQVASAPFRIPIPEYAPEGRYALDFYMKTGRRYVSSYYPARDTVGRMPVSIPITGRDVPVDIPVINMTKTHAGGLVGSLGPFVDADSVPFTVWLTNESIPVALRVTACPWDDSVMINGLPEKDCFVRSYYSANSPLNASLPLPSPGAWGVRLETLHDGDVASTSLLRAVRNGTSPRIAELLPVRQDGMQMLKAIVLPSQDNSPDERLVLSVDISVFGKTIQAFEQELLFPDPVTLEENQDQSIELLLPVQELPNKYSLHARVATVQGEIEDTFTRHVDWCGLRGLCCHPQMTAVELATVPRIR